MPIIRTLMNALSGYLTQTYPMLVTDSRAQMKLLQSTYKAMYRIFN